MVKLLLAEDEEMLAQAISYVLDREGIAVTHAKNGEEAIRLLEREVFDIAILDITMPKVDGLAVTRHIRQQQEIPILMLTALSGEADLLAGFEVGADDYLTKPFNYKELLARIKALLRRHQTQKSQTAVRATLTHHRLYINPNSHLARMEDQTLSLTLTEFRILTYLMTHLGRVCNGKEILETIQGYEVEEIEAREILRVHIQHLRQKMKTQRGQPEHIENVYGVGYIIRG